MRIIFPFLISFFAIIGVYGQSNSVYNFRNIANDELLEISTITGDENGNKYIVAKTLSAHYLIKLNNDEDIVWQKQILNGIAGWGFAYFSQAHVYNANLYLLAYLYNDPMQYFLSKFDLNGNLLWSRLLISVDGVQYYNPSMAISSENGLTIASSTFRSIDIFSLDLDGNTQWIKNFTTDSNELKNPNFDILVTESGNILGCAKAQNDISFYCLDQNGNIIWTKRILEGFDHYTRTKCIVEIDTNRFFICGFRATPSGGIIGDNGYAFYGFIDSSGNFLDLRIINELGSNAEMKSAILLNNGNILMQGYSSDLKLVYVTIDTLGNIIEAYELTDYSYTYINQLLTGINTMTENETSIYSSDKTNLFRFSDFSSFECVNIIPLTLTTTGKNPGIASISNHIAFHAPGSIILDPTMQTTTADLQIENACSTTFLEENTPDKFKIYPSILSNNQSIFIDHNIIGTIDFRIISLTGEIVMQNSLANSLVEISGLNAGMYLIQLVSNNSIIGYKKFVVTN